MKFYTDYIFHSILGDELGKEAPIREVEVLSYDGNYCQIMVDGHEANIKIYYIYAEPGRSGKVPHIKPEDIA